MKRIQLISSLLLLYLAISKGYTQDKHLKTFSLNHVQLKSSPFFNAQQVGMDYILALETDRLLAPFLKDAGLEPKADNYPNWENTGLDGHIGGHYLTALAQMYAATANKELIKRLDYMVEQLRLCQDENGNGYVGGIPGGNKMWQEIRKGNIDAGAFSLNKKWVPLYNIHKTFAGLRDAFLIAGNLEAKNVLIKLTDWWFNLTKDLTEAQIQDMLRSEHGGLNEVFADVAFITQNDKYLELAERFSHKAILNPLLRAEDDLTGKHANTQIPKVIGYKRIADLTQNKAWNEAAEFFWENVVTERTLAFGGNSVREHFNPVNDFSELIKSEQGPETCNTYNMLRLSKMMFQSSGSSKYIEFYERALYNHILSSQHPEKGGFVYFTPVRPGHYRVYSQPATSMWCCVGSGIENHSKYGELIYTYTNDALYINLFIPSELDWKEKGVKLEQMTTFPEEGKTSISIEENRLGKFDIKIRYPSWVQKGGLSISVNQKPIEIEVKAGEYVTVSKRWKQGDKIEINLPMQTRLERLPDNSNFLAVLHGPLVLAAKLGNQDIPYLFADSSRMGHVANGKKHPLNEMPMIVTDAQNLEDFIEPVPDKKLTFKMPELIYPEKYQSLELIPFYKLHDARYVMYWQKETPKSLENIKAELAKAEAKAAKLEEATIDMVNCGEQQPEADHFVKSEDSRTGIYRNRHWRAAKGWFAYQMQDKNKEASLLRLTYFGADKGSKFEISINDKVIATERLDGSQGDVFFTKDYKIPDTIKNANTGQLIIKFTAEKGSLAGKIYEVRLMRYAD